MFLFVSDAGVSKRELKLRKKLVKKCKGEKRAKNL